MKKNLILAALALLCASAFAADSSAPFGLQGRVTIIRARTSGNPTEKPGSQVKVGLRDEAAGVLWLRYEGDSDAHGHRGQFQVTGAAGGQERYLEINSPEESDLISLVRSATNETFGTVNPQLLVPTQLEEDADYSRMALASLFASMSLRTTHPQGDSVDASAEGKVPLKALLGGDENLAIMTAAAEISAFRVVPDSTADKKKAHEAIDGFSCDPDSVVLTGGAMRDALVTFCDVGNFGKEGAEKFGPSVIFRLSSPAGALDAAVSFQSNELSFYRDGKLVQREISLGVTKNSFTAEARKTFVALAKKAFPKDKEIAALKE
jgi:hypothetical protein